MEAVGPFGGWCGATISAIISPFYNHFATRAMYCFNAGTKVADHKTEISVLKLKRDDVQRKIQDGKELLRTVPTDGATSWLEDVNSAVLAQEANDLLYTERYKLWCCSPDLLEKYKIGKRADDELKKVKSLISSTPGDGAITQDPGPRHVEDMAIDPAPLPPSRTVILLQALRFIRSNDPNEGMVGMWGPDKDDNTYLVKTINNTFLKQSLFDFVIFLTSPSDCSVKDIQEKILRRLELDMMSDGNDVTRATRIRERLETKNFLMILDDRRQNLNLREVGIPYPLGFVGDKKRKVVIMSQSGYRSVGSLMGESKSIELPILQEGEARDLFCQSVNYAGNLYSDPDIGAYATDLVRQIHGLPSKLVSYGKGMRGRTDVPSWQRAVYDAEIEFSVSPSTDSIVGLIEDDLKLGVIGIWGPGGVGKTHLLKQIQKSLNGKTTVIFVTASRACSVSKLQKNLLQALELKGVDDEEIHRGMIHRFLEDKSFLLLLDDLWETIDLQAVGIPFPLGIDTVNKHKRKVVLTTRSITVCGGMEVRKQIKVPYLEENEAWELFRKKVGNETLSSPGIEDRARILVTEMKGLPLALITVGKAMYGKFHSAQWDSAIQHMIKSCCTDSKTDAAVQMERVVFGMIKFSYDDLESNTLRDCLSSCVLWPEDAWIDREDLARCWIGLGLVVEEDIQSSYTTAYSLMGNLTGACLLEDCGESNLFVKLHDVIRDMSLWISCGCGANNGKWSVRAGVGPDVKLSIPWSSAEYISLMSNDLSELPSVGAALELRVLCLKKNHLDETKIAGVLVNPAKLTYLDLSHNCLNGIPDSLCLLVELQHLDLSRNYSLRQVPDSFGKLIKLMFLYLQDTHITKIPEKVISRLTQLEIIDMRVTPEDCMSADTQSNVYRELGPLKHLKAVGTSVGLFESCSSHDTAADLPIRSLNLGKTRGEKFRIELDFSSKKRMERDFHLSDMLSFGFAKTTLYELNISDNSYVREIIIMQKSAQEPGSFGILKDLMMVGLVNLRKVKWTEISPTNVFPNLTSLMVSCCNKLCHLSWAMYLPRLERLGLDWVYMKNAFSRHHEDMNWRGQLNSKTFPCLKFLAVSHCKSLVTIADSDVTFPYLEVLKVTFCPNLQTLPFQAASLPPNLRVLEMDDAESWERLELEKGVKSFLGTKLQCRK